MFASKQRSSASYHPSALFLVYDTKPMEVKQYKVLYVKQHSAVTLLAWVKVNITTCCNILKSTQEIRNKKNFVWFLNHFPFSKGKEGDRRLCWCWLNLLLFCFSSLLTGLRRTRHTYWRGMKKWFAGTRSPASISSSTAIRCWRPAGRSLTHQNTENVSHVIMEQVHNRENTCRKSIRLAS